MGPLFGHQGRNLLRFPTFANAMSGDPNENGFLSSSVRRRIVVSVRPIINLRGQKRRTLLSLSLVSEATNAIGSHASLFEESFPRADD